MDPSKSCLQWSDCFPAGLRVLVVDNDSTHLNILQNMLQICNYQVTTCNLTRDAVDVLEERKDGFDIVMSDVNLPDMDGFTLLQHIRLKMDHIPVIMMSVDGETSRVMRGVQQGACDYLLKPIRIEELRNIWQHVVRKRLHEASYVQGQQSSVARKQCDDGYLLSSSAVIPCVKKRKDDDIKENSDNRECGGDPSSSVKKARVAWSVDLHHKFVKAVNQIGVDKAGPKKILELMGEPSLTRENVASHLQKYRLYLRRSQNEKELKSAPARMTPSDTSSVHPAGNVCLQSSIRQTSVTVQQNVVTNGMLSVPQHKIHIHNAKGTLSMPMEAKSTKALFDEDNSSRISFNHFVGPLVSEEVKSEPQIKPHFHSEHQLDHYRLTMPRIQVDSVSYNPRFSTGEPNISPLCSTNRSYDGVGKVTIVENHNKDALVSAWSMTNQHMGHNEFNHYSSQGDLYPLTQELTADVPRQMYDSVNIDCECSSDPLECLVIDQGLYIS